MRWQRTGVCVCIKINFVAFPSVFFRIIHSVHPYEINMNGIMKIFILPTNHCHGNNHKHIIRITHISEILMMFFFNVFLMIMFENGIVLNVMKRKKNNQKWKKRRSSNHIMNHNNYICPIRQNSFAKNASLIFLPLGGHRYNSISFNLNEIRKFQKISIFPSNFNQKQRENRMMLQNLTTTKKKKKMKLVTVMWPKKKN